MALPPHFRNFMYRDDDVLYRFCTNCYSYVWDDEYKCKFCGSKDYRNIDNKQIVEIYKNKHLRIIKLNRILNEK